MKRLAAVLFVAAHILCTLAGPVQEASVLSYGQTKCSRLFPWTAEKPVSRCTYMCRGWPFRHENVQDGVSCLDSVGEGVCLNGKCVKRDLYLAVLSEARSSPTYSTTFMNGPNTSKSPPNGDVPPVHEDTMMSRQSADTDFFSGNGWDTSPEVTQSTTQRKTMEQSFTAPVSSTDRHYEPQIEQQTTVASVNWKNQASTGNPTTLHRDSTGSAESNNADISSSTAHMGTPLSNWDANSDFVLVYDGKSSAATHSDDQPYSKPEVHSTKHKTWSAVRQTSRQPVLTTLSSHLHSAAPSFQTTHSARTTTTADPITWPESSSGFRKVSEWTGSSINNKVTNPSSSSRIDEMTANRNHPTVAEDNQNSPSLNPSTQHGSTPHYYWKHTEEPPQTKDSSRSNSSTMNRHLIAPPTPTIKASSATHANVSLMCTRGETPGATVISKKPPTSTGTSTAPTRSAGFISVRHGGISALPDGNTASTVISHEHVPDHQSTTSSSDLSSNLRPSGDQPTPTSTVARPTDSTIRDAVSEKTVGPNDIIEHGSTPYGPLSGATAGVTKGTKEDAVLKTAGDGNEVTENGGMLPAATSGTTTPTHSVAALQTRDPSSFELSIQINVKGGIPFLKR